MNRLAVEIKNLSDGMEEEFWRYVERDTLDYRRFISDWKNEKQDADILLALEEGDIQGLMLVFKKSKVHLRGSRNAVKALLGHVNLDEFTLIAPVECKGLILERYEPQICEEMYMMYLKKGDERILGGHEVVRLTVDDAEQVSELMRVSDPVWAETTIDEVKDRMSWSYWLGIKRDGKVVSVGKTTLDEMGCVVGVMATDKDHRNNGYATSVVSALVEEAFKKHDSALIFVLTDNHQAIHIYEKIGFRPYKTYLFFKK